MASEVFKNDAKLRAYLSSALRRVWSWSTERKRALSRAKIGRGKYQCQKCRNISTLKQVDVDHKVPVGCFPGSRNDKENRTWDSYLNALFCSADGLQILCKSCHKAKTFVKKEL